MSQDFERSSYDMILFGFTADQVSLERKYRIIQVFENLLNDAFGKVTNLPHDSAEWKEQRDEVVRRMRDACQEKLQLIGDLDKKYFNVPPHVLLAHDFDFANNYEEIEEQEKDKTFQGLKQQILENSIKISCLKLENDGFESIYKYVKDEQTVYEHIMNSIKALDLKKLREAALKE